MAEEADRPADDGPLMTLAEAAAATGRPAEAIRAMSRRGKLKTVKGNDGRLLVAVPASLLQPEGSRPAGRPAGRGQDDDGRVAGLEIAVEEWRTAAEDARLAAAVAAAERDAAKATARVEVEGKEAVIVELRRELVDLQAELARLRRPWWRWLWPRGGEGGGGAE